ncbi:MAG: DUF4870 domain-containing protein [Planctomycetes bacterium]|mgnify:CR=1 FL=1|nr:DUF4870 domain-containing protein [Planctomycetota bacterium]MCB9910931.1 DUF4870 domain-containing protein [Planctomycetota bacterium]MCB9911602.1 DUF4870 domain-containing protein [Planctomycetota bacterium]HPF15706.1 DUF4870 domain-containing protein [Planctomycetota bacterium]HRV80674.1 DUF4870 domain-containing protein [Planctomycetota bacterium]
MLLNNEEPVETEDSAECRWGVIAHLSALLPLPLFDLLGPFLVLITKGDQSFFIRRQAISALNFHITVLLAYLLCLPFFLILIGVAMAWMVGIASMVLAFIAAIKASEGKSYRYPFSLQILR